MAFFGLENCRSLIASGPRRARAWFQARSLYAVSQHGPSSRASRGGYCHRHGAGRRPGHRGDLLRNRGLAGFEPAAGVAGRRRLCVAGIAAGRVGIILQFHCVALGDDPSPRGGGCNSSRIKVRKFDTTEWHGQRSDSYRAVGRVLELPIADCRFEEGPFLVIDSPYSAIGRVLHARHGRRRMQCSSAWPSPLYFRERSDNPLMPPNARCLADGRKSEL